MTQGQITSFYISARCCWTKYVAKAIDYVKFGDPTAKTWMTNSILVDRLLDTINCYDPDAEENCLTIDEILEIINTIMSILGICGDLESLPETTTECCNGVDDLEFVPTS